MYAKGGGKRKATKVAAQAQGAPAKVQKKSTGSSTRSSSIQPSTMTPAASPSTAGKRAASPCEAGPSASGKPCGTAADKHAAGPSNAPSPSAASSSAANNPASDSTSTRRSSTADGSSFASSSEGTADDMTRMMLVIQKVSGLYERKLINEAFMFEEDEAPVMLVEVEKGRSEENGWRVKGGVLRLALTGTRKLSRGDRQKLCDSLVDIFMEYHPGRPCGHSTGLEKKPMLGVFRKLPKLVDGLGVRRGAVLIHRAYDGNFLLRLFVRDGTAAQAREGSETRVLGQVTKNLKAVACCGRTCKQGGGGACAAANRGGCYVAGQPGPRFTGGFLMSSAWLAEPEVGSDSFSDSD